jgi:hypothetical protein
VQGRHPSRPSVRSAAALALAATALVVPPAHAYVDPGTGSFVLQVLLAAFFGAAYTFRRAWRGLIERVRRAPRAAQPAEPDAPADPR